MRRSQILKIFSRASSRAHTRDKKIPPVVLPISLCEEREAGCRGAAMLAQLGSGGEITIPAPPVTAVVEPVPARAAVYREKFARWRLFSGQLRELAPQLA